MRYPTRVYQSDQPSRQHLDRRGWRLPALARAALRWPPLRRPRPLRLRQSY